MSDPHGPTRVLQPSGAALQQPSAAIPTDGKLQDARRAAGSEYDVLGEICEVGEGSKGGITYLARRRSATRLDALRLVTAGEYVEVVGTMGVSLEEAGNLCPNCSAQLRPGVRFCGNCRANLSTLPLTDAPGSMSIAEWMETRSQAAMHGYDVLGQVDDQRMRSAAGYQPGATLLLARAVSTSKIVALLMEPSAGGASGVLSLDQSNLLAKVVASLFDGAAAPAVPAPPYVAPVAPPPPIAQPPQPPPPTLAEPAPPPVVPPAPPPAQPPAREFPWMRVAALTLSGAAVIAAIAWLISAISGRNDDRDARVAAALARADSIRADSIRADSISRASIVVVDSATVRFSSTLPTGASVTVDDAPVEGRSIKLAPGRHMLSASAAGYRTASAQLNLRSGQTLTWPSQRLKKDAPVAVAPKPAAPAPQPTSPCRDAARASDWARALDVCARESGAADGNAFAERTLGTMYERGLGVRPSVAVAAVWYTSAANHGDRDAQAALGVLYANGDGVPKSDAEAIRWLKKAAAAGSQRAREELARRNW